MPPQIVAGNGGDDLLVTPRNLRGTQFLGHSGVTVADGLSVGGFGFLLMTRAATAGRSIFTIRRASQKGNAASRPASRPRTAGLSEPEAPDYWTACAASWSSKRQQRGGGKAVGGQALDLLILAQRGAGPAAQHAIRRAGIKAQLCQVGLELHAFGARQRALVARPGMLHRRRRPPCGRPAAPTASA